MPSAPEISETARVATGIAGLDERLGGGLPRASVSVLVGPAGSGKTTFGLGFLKEATLQRPGVHFGFYETPERLCAKAQALGVDLKDRMASGAVAMLWRPLTENLLDKLAYDLLKAVRETRAERLFIDGLAGFERATVDPHRMVEFFAALTNELRAIGVTTVSTWEVKELSGPWMINPSPEILSQLDNVIGMHHQMTGGRLRRGMTVLKVRDSVFDTTDAEVAIAGSGKGLHVIGTMPSHGMATGNGFA